MPKILIIRHDNIGDLICVTPLIHALKKTLPDAEISAFVNSYNAPVLANHPDLDSLYYYTKAKHRKKNQSLFAVYWEKIKLIYTLRQQQFDFVILATPDPTQRLYQLAQWLAPQKIILMRGQTNSPFKLSANTIGVSRPLHFNELHEVERVFCLGEPIVKLTQKPSPVHIEVSKIQKAWAFQQIKKKGNCQTSLNIGIHISARKKSQRWSVENFVTLLTQLNHNNPMAQFLLFWSPGSEFHPQHPGDDEKAAAILAATKSLPIYPFRTQELEELIAGLSLCDVLICSDGGAMHVGAGVGVPILCFFGESDPKRWRPWGVPHVVLQSENQQVALISPYTVIQAFESLRAQFEQPRPSSKNENES